MKDKFNVSGMTCSACQAHVEKAVKSLNGVTEAQVNLLKNNMTVSYDEKKVSSDDIILAVQKAGYRASLVGKTASSAQPQNQQGERPLFKLIIAISLLLLTMYFSMGNMMWGFPSPDIFDHRKNPTGFALLQFILTLPVLFIYRRYFESGYKKLFKGAPNMDTLIALGATASVVYGIFALFMIIFGTQGLSNAYANGDLALIEKFKGVISTYCNSLYFESAGMILTFISLGKYLEGLSKKKTTKAIEELMELAPDNATLIRDGEEITVKISEVKPKDVVIVRKGESVPIDGVIIKGNCAINEANITGESMPVSKGVGSEVFCSTVLDSGYIEIEAVKVGEDTSISNIIKLVDEASNSKAPISRLADKISGIFVPVVLSLALLSFIINLLVSKSFELSLNFAISVVVIACPCALGLATPVAIMVASGKGAQNGLLVKNAEILENAHRITTVVLDKTGTITEGTPSVTDYYLFDSSTDILSAIYSIEQRSEHPLAKAITAFAKSKNCKAQEVENFQSIDGEGLKGTVGGKEFFIGNLKTNVISEIPTEIKSKANELSLDGKTPLVITVNGVISALIALKDRVKPQSKEAIKRLQKRNVKVIMLTGDNQTTANVIAKEVGISEVIAEVHPAQKQEVVTNLKGDNLFVAMVGDGVNDAPALMSADIGIAMGGGSDIAAESGDIVLLNKSLMGIVNAIDLSKRTLNTIKLGLFWAFFYNCICVAIASGIFYYSSGLKINPMIGSIAMSLSSVSVVLNALTINFLKFEKIKTIGDCGQSCPACINENIKENNMKTYTVKVNGMMCMRCVAHVEKACLKVDGVSSAKADHEKGIVEITCDGEQSLAQAKANIIAEDYEVIE